MSFSPQYSKLRVGVGKFFYGPGCIEVLAQEVLRLGGRPLIIGGPKSVRIVIDRCDDSFKSAGIQTVIQVHEGACTRKVAKEYQQIAAQNDCTLIIGIGGGKCIDLAKCTATFADMDLINVPTSVATCCASSSVCIMYSESGKPDGSVPMNKEPDVVIADTDIISTAPKRMLAAGMFDAIAKLPEVIHNLRIESYRDSSLEKYICTVNSRAIFDFLTSESINVYDKGVDSGRFTDVILTNLLHTSIVSGFSLGLDQLALAHGLYDFMRRSFTEQAEHIMHGEIVAVGVIMQMYFNKANQEQIDKAYSLMEHMSMPLNLPQIGFEPTKNNIQLLLDYLIPNTSISPDNLPKLKDAIEKLAS